MVKMMCEVYKNQLYNHHHAKKPIDETTHYLSSKA
jgi:hypothetical protein